MNLNWFRRSAQRTAYAAISPCPAGLAAVQLARNGGRPAVARFGVQEGSELTAERLQGSAAAWGLRDTPLIALLDAAHYQTVQLDMPNVPEEELASALRWQIKDLIPFPVDEATLEHLTTPGGSAGRNPNLYVVAGQTAAVQSLAEPYKQAGLRLEVVDVAELAQRNLSALIEPEGYAVGLLHCEEDRALLTFTHSGELVMSRRVEGHGATGSALHDKFALEVQRSVDYFERQYHTLPLAKLHLAPMPGGETLLARLREYLTLPVEALDLGRVFDLGAHDALRDTRMQNGVFHLLGAALREASA